MKLLRSLFAVVAACAPVDESLAPDPAVDAIAGGVRDRGRHPAVVALRLRGGGLCSGTLIGPRAVLTARHCVSETDEVLQCPTRRAQVIRDLDPRDLDVTRADDARAAPTDARGVALVLPEDRTLCGTDVAVLLLDRALPGVTPLRIRTREVVEGETVTVVGYGRRGDTRRAGLGERFFRAAVPVQATTEGEFRTGVSGCPGDSGGPALDPRSGQILGVVSRGGQRCNTPDASLVFTRATAALGLLREARRRAAWGPE
ncbi:MAG: S1 family peptidase [Polyangiales bacterium]